MPFNSRSKSATRGENVRMEFAFAVAVKPQMTQRAAFESAVVVKLVGENQLGLAYEHTDHTYITHFGMFADGPVDWSSRLLKVAASSFQDETAADCVAAKRNIFLRNFLGHLLDVIGTKLNGGATVLLMDKSTAGEQTDHAGASKKIEHYKRWEYFLRECQLDGAIKAHFIRTCNQVADCFTKVLDKTTFLKLRQHLIR
eukprot:1625357-Pleurochrysis_carterae.AAC.4